MNIKLYEQITARVIALLEQGTVPWHKTWTVQTGLPRNFVSQKPYRGINPFLLLGMGYESPFWLTFRQAIQLGGSVKKGEKSCAVVFWKRIKVEDEPSGANLNIPLLRMYHVFNVSQCEGLKKGPASEEVSNNLTAKPAEIIVNMPQPPIIKHGMAQAFYAPSSDTVGMPQREGFESGASYYSVLFHELVHSTGSEKRLNRASITERNGYGSDPYCKEELIAELGSAFVCGYAGIVDRTIDNSAAYVDGWLRQLKYDKTLIVHAAAQAQKAADFILGHKFAESEVADD